MDKKQREARRRQEDMALNRALIWVGAAIVLELVLLYINGNYVNYQIVSEEVDRMLAIHDALASVRTLALVLTAVSLVWTAISYWNKKPLALPVAALSAAAAVAVCCHISLVFRDSGGVQMLMILVPGLAGLALAYYLYQKEFFLSAAIVVLAMVGLWFVRSGVGLGLEIGLALAGIILILAAAIVLRQKGGLLPGPHAVQALPKEASYAAIFASALLGLAAVVGALALGTTAAYYLIFVMAAWLFALLVYYTVKMM